MSQLNYHIFNIILIVIFKCVYTSDQPFVFKNTEYLNWYNTDIFYSKLTSD